MSAAIGAFIGSIVGTCISVLCIFALCAVIVKTTPEQIDMLLDVNSIEKCIDKLKLENLQLKQRMQYDKIHEDIYGASKNKTEVTE